MDDFICRRLRIPNQLDVIMLVNGAITELLKYSNYEPFGDMPPEEVTQMFTEMWLDFIESDACMIGQVAAFATETAPFGWLECDGGIYNRADYPLLASVIHPDLLVGLDEFQTPDLTGRFILGGTGDAGFYPAHDTGGTETVSLTESEMPAHTHTAELHSHMSHDHPPIPTASLVAVPPDIVLSSGPHFPWPGDAANVNILPAGGGDAHNNMPPFYILRYFICAR